MAQETVIPAQAIPFVAQATGYVQFIDMPGISERLKSDQTRVYLYARPGDYLIKGQVIGHATGVKDGETDAIARRLTIGPHRTFEQDASYGLLVLSETASRALSPGINDPGTAIAVICRQEKLLLEWAHAEPTKTKPLFPRIFLPDTSRHAMIENAFAGADRGCAGYGPCQSRARDEHAGACLCRRSPAAGQRAQASARREPRDQFLALITCRSGRTFAISGPRA
jgi:uncharacterized membrane protein